MIKMMSLPNLKCNVDWEVCHRKLSRPILSTIWNRTYYRGWCQHLIWGLLWIGADSEIMLSWPDVKCYMDWKGCDRKLSRPIWCNMRIRTVDRGWCYDLIWGAIWTAADCEIMLSWLSLKCYVDWKGCDIKISRSIGWHLRVSTDDIGWCNDLIWGDMWIGIYSIWCCLDQIYIGMCIGKTVTPRYHDDIEVVYGLNRIIIDDILT
jgi:hypothetical protein